MGILTSWNCSGERHLLIGVSGLTNTRVQSILSDNAKPIIVTNGIDKLSENLLSLAKQGKVELYERLFDINDLFTLGRSTVGGIVDKVYVNLNSNYHDLKLKIFEKCQVHRIPINTTESSELSTFTILSTFTDGDFQLGITTSGKGCKLANRIKREIVKNLPNNMGEICDKIGELRNQIQKEDNMELISKFEKKYDNLIQDQLGENEEDSIQSSKFNAFISEFNMNEYEKKMKRSRWLNQVVEYYPFNQLSNISINDLSDSYKSYEEPSVKNTKVLEENKRENKEEETEDSKETLVSIASNNNKKSINKGSISLVGAGPGSLSLLTLGALQEINTADLVLADKLVPQQVVDLIPSKTEKFIARKFPGNAEAAQEELLNLGLKALKEGKKVVRLKQGDPYIFGRGGEEYLFFEKNGFKPVVLPGITSALSSTVSSQIPATQRDVADQVLICTGTGRRGVLPKIPEFVKTRTTVFLMSLHRINDLVEGLINNSWDPEIPAAIVERSSCPDQRVTRTKLKYLNEAIEAIGSRPPGLLVVGYACEVLKQHNEKWIVEEGYDDGSNSVNDILKSLS